MEVQTDNKILHRVRRHDRSRGFTDTIVKCSLVPYNVITVATTYIPTVPVLARNVKATIGYCRVRTVGHVRRCFAWHLHMTSPHQGRA